MARIYLTTNNSNWGMFLDVSETNYSIENNNSTVSANLYLYRPSSASYYGGSASFSITVDGQTQSGNFYPTYPTNISAGEGNAHHVGGFTYTVGHNSDGSKSISFSASFSANFNPTSASGSGSMALTTIPRASEISSVSTANIGSSATITVNRKSNSFTHTITYSFGSLSGRIVTKSSNTSITWTIPSSFYAQIPNSKTGSGTLTITTYNGNTQIGSSSSKTFTVSIDENACKPAIDGSVVFYYGNSTWDSLVKGQVTARVSYTTSPNNSATISNVKINGQTATSSPYDIVKIDTDTIEIVSTDSRGYSSTKTLVKDVDFTYIPYFELSCNVSFKRASSTSDEVKLSFSGNFYNGNIGNRHTNTVTIYSSYREKGTSSWTSLGFLRLDTDFKVNGNIFYSGNGSSEEEISLGAIFDYKKSYEFSFTALDSYFTSITIIKEVTKGHPVINWGEDYFNVNGDIRQNNKSILEPSLCKMITNGTQTFTQNREEVSIWDDGFEYGDYEIDTANNRLIITNTTLCEISGAFGGGDAVWARIHIYEENTEIEVLSTLVQPSGNGYFFSPLQTAVIELDPTKTYYVYMTCIAYNVSSFTLNAGFGSQATWISAKKIK